MHSRQTIEERARAVAAKVTPILQAEEAEEPYLVEAFKYAFLVLRRPRRFLEQFGAGNLEIDTEEVQEAFWRFRHQIPGGAELLPEEEMLLKHHNEEAKAYIRAQRLGG